MMTIEANRSKSLSKDIKSEGSFFIYFALQFILITLSMFMNVKIGAMTLALTLLMTFIVLIRCSSQGYDMSHAKNGMLYIYIIPGIYYIFQITNPNHVQEAWNIAIAQYWVYPFALALMVPVAIRSKKGIECLLIVWSIFILAATAKGYWQKSHGFSQKELYFLYVLGGYKTHIIWSGIRYFSFFSDAANFGVHAAMATTVFLISTFYTSKYWVKIYYLVITLCGLYCMAISGTRAAVVIPIFGAVMYCILSKSFWKMVLSIITIGVVFSFFYFTNIGSSNQYIRKMRSAFRPTNDASYLVRMDNRERMKELMDWHPMGYGLGLAKGERFKPKEYMPYPPDSWLVGVWIETGTTGLVLYILIHALLFAWCSWILLFKIRNKQLRGIIAAWLCMDAGFFISAYVNDVMQYPNSIVVYTGFALCFAGVYIDESIQENHKSITTK